ncbi:hypothetical protein JAAARDRAFT_47225 [Jaapia argillacea MUCL 33604]|uniref:Uncharacterized protein n=1 Tax=Jaapia argillacea MUCL 33604 TaxID=933084 RepID=A0A067PTG4_9AGAM|nr:hypothetical protein JAAARDRAFT_47225 [Jaapia argillacea MUCL 33604]
MCHFLGIFPPAHQGIGCGFVPLPPSIHLHKALACDINPDSLRLGTVGSFNPRREMPIAKKDLAWISVWVFFTSRSRCRSAIHIWYRKTIVVLRGYLMGACDKASLRRLRNAGEFPQPRRRRKVILSGGVLVCEQLYTDLVLIIIPGFPNKETYLTLPAPFPADHCCTIDLYDCFTFFSSLVPLSNCMRHKRCSPPDLYPIQTETPYPAVRMSPLVEKAFLRFAAPSTHAQMEESLRVDNSNLPQAIGLRKWPFALQMLKTGLSSFITASRIVINFIWLQCAGLDPRFHLHFVVT